MKQLPRPWLKTFPLLTAAICLASTSAVAQVELEEIVVTAQKREQNLQDVPISVSAFTGAQLQEGVIKDVFDLATNVPGLRMAQSQNSTQSNFAIRGVGTSAQNFGLESSVGLYVDGVYRSRQSSMINNMVDMEGVEVLRGPQGTLFGKNTPSGAILFRTAAPSHESEGFVEVTTGNLGLLNLSAAANFSAIEDVLAFRVTGFSSERDGYITDANSGETDSLNDRSRYGVRLQALYTPTDELSVRFIADYAEIDEVCCGSLTIVDSIVANSTANPDGSPIFGSDAALLGLGGTVFTAAQYDDYRTALNMPPTSTNDDTGYSMEIKWDRDDYSITSVTAYREFNSVDTIDSDFSDVDLIVTTNDSTQSSFSQEFRIDYSKDRVNAVFGAYYFEQEIGLDYDLEAGAALDPYAQIVLGLGDFINGMNGLNAATGGLFPAAALAYPTPAHGVHTSDQDHQSWAIFGQFDYDLTEDLVLTVGLRYTEEDKDLTTIYRQTDADGVDLPLGPAITLADVGGAGVGLGQLGAALAVGDFSLLGDAAFMGQFVPYTTEGWGYYLFNAFTPRSSFDETLTDDQITGSVKLSWSLNEDAMVYASFGTGYKSGGTNTDRIPEGFDPLFDAETSESFEVGFKGEFPDQALRLNIAAHYTTVDDFQANAFTGDGFNLQNAGSLETYGAEVEAFWRPTESLTATMAYAYSFGEFETFKQGNCWVATPFHTGVADPGSSAGAQFCDRSGDTIGNNPEHYVTLGLRNEFAISSGVSAYVMGEYTYLSETVLDANNDPLKIQESYGLLNLRAGVSFEELDMDLTLWGRNVLDEKYLQTTFDVPVQDGKLNSYPSVPATYGLTLNKRF